MSTQPGFALWIFRSLRRIMRAVDVYSHKLSAEYKITSPQLLCLQTLYDDGPLTLSALAKLVHLSPSTVVGIMDRLEQKDLVVRERSTRDRRIVLGHITIAGRELVETVPSLLQNRLATGLSSLEEGELIVIAQSLERIVGLLEVEGGEVAPVLEAGPIEETGPTNRELPPYPPAGSPAASKI